MIKTPDKQIPTAETAQDKAAADVSQMSLGGLPIRWINWALTVFCLILAALLIFAYCSTSDSYTVLRDKTDIYMSCQHTAMEFKLASDRLTESARSFVASGEPAFAEDYFKEANVDRRREKFVKELEEYFPPEELTDLRDAMNISNELMKTEFLAMRLACEAFGVDPASVDPAVARIELTPEQLAMSSDAQRDEALRLLFDSEYAGSKSAMLSRLNSLIDGLVRDIRADQLESMSEHNRYLSFMLVSMTLLLVFVVLEVILVSVFVFMPMRRGVKHIVKQQFIPVRGSREMRILASSYNKIFEKIRTKQEKLSYEATHDPLTGLSNRGVFEKISAGFDSSGMGLLIIDVDNFKGINDTHGHDVGDKVLRDVAKLLVSSFRSGDTVCRIGGDEFLVILNGITEDNREMLLAKMASISAKLSAEDRDPPVTLSVGGAFGDSSLSVGELFKNADVALYKVKEAGKNGVGFYGD